MKAQQVVVRLAITVDSLRLKGLVREIRAQAPQAEWETLQAFAMELLALAEAENQGQEIAVVPAKALRDLQGLLAHSGKPPANRKS